MAIEFTQYLLPDGRQRPVTIERSEEVEKKATAIIAKGHRFEAEILNGGQVSFTISALDPDEPDVAIEICANGPPVEAAVDKLVNDFYEEMEKDNG